MSQKVYSASRNMNDHTVRTSSSKDRLCQDHMLKMNRVDFLVKYMAWSWNLLKISDIVIAFAYSTFTIIIIIIIISNSIIIIAIITNHCHHHQSLSILINQPVSSYFAFIIISIFIIIFMSSSSCRHLHVVIFVSSSSLPSWPNEWKSRILRCSNINLTQSIVRAFADHKAFSWELLLESCESWTKGNARSEKMRLRADEISKLN